MWLSEVRLPPPDDALNVAVTVVSAVGVKVQGPVPVHGPDHPVNEEAVAATAVSVTAAPLVKLAVQAEGQLIPAGLLVTVPEPVPLVTTVTLTEGVLDGPKLAVTDVLAVRVRLHVPVPVQAPDQPVNVEPELGVAVSVTEAPLLKVALQVVGQLMPAGLLAMVPEPVPAV